MLDLVNNTNAQSETCKFDILLFVAESFAWLDVLDIAVSHAFDFKQDMGLYHHVKGLLWHFMTNR